MRNWQAGDVFVCIILIELAVYVCIAFGVGLDILCSALSLRFYLTMEAWFTVSLLLLSTFLVFFNSLETAPLITGRSSCSAPSCLGGFSSPPSLARGSVVQCPVYSLTTSATLLIKLENVGVEKDSDMS